ncbi:MAG: nucleotidyltransferase family protein [Vescimonas sp.]
MEHACPGVHIRMPSGSGWRGRNLCPVPAAGGGEAAGAQDAALLAQPNNILAIEYPAALRRADFPMEPVTFPRRGGQHDGPVMEGIAPPPTSAGSCGRDRRRRP